MIIKALSLWQPWASLIAVGAKKYETRSWKTSYRGPLLICSAKTHKGQKLVCNGDRKTYDRMREHIGAIWAQACGFAHCIVNLTDCITTIWLCENTERFSVTAEEKLFGDFSPGRYAWKLENVRTIKPFPVKGRQGLFNIEIDKNKIRELK
jgi:hypothetical protein